MAAIMDIYNLIRDLIDEAKKNKNNDLYDKLIDIKMSLSELEEENRSLKEQLNLRYNVTYNEDNTAFTINDDKNKIQYCSICYGNNGKLIPYINGKCRVCEENWHKSFSQNIRS